MCFFQKRRKKTIKEATMSTKVPLREEALRKVTNVFIELYTLHTPTNYPTYPIGTMSRLGV